LFIVMGLVTLVTIDRLQASRALVRHTLLVLRQVESMMGHVGDAETGQRGYLLTNEDRYLQPYRNGLAEIARDTAALRELTRDNSAQQHRLDALSGILAVKASELERTIELQRAS